MRAVLAVFVLVALVGCGQAAPRPPAAPRLVGPQYDPRERDPQQKFHPIPPPPAVVEAPTRMVIPTIGVNAAVESVAFLGVPQDPADVGWFVSGSRPGQAGTATFDGHLDWIGFKPAVFWDLGKLQAGDEIDIVGPDGKAQPWAVDLVQTVPYTSVPPDWLYARDGPPRISLITCGGSWTGAIYSDRLLVRAVPGSN